MHTILEKKPVTRTQFLVCLFCLFTQGSPTAADLVIEDSQARYSQGRILHYDHLGVDFIVEEAPELHIEGAVVYTPQDKDRQEIEIDQREVVPGIGAYGIKIGDPVNALDSLVGVRLHSTTNISSGDFQNDVLYYYEFEDGRTMEITVRDEHVLTISIRGSFRTPEGLTESGTEQDIRQVYGTPTNEWTVPSGSNPLWGMLTPVLLLVGGALTGRLQKRIHRRNGYGYAGPGIAVALSALMCAAALVTGAYFASASAFRLDNPSLRLLLSSAFIAAASGGVAATVLELLRKRAASTLLRSLAFPAVIIAGFGGGFLASLALPGNLITIGSFAPIGIALVLFSIGLLSCSDRQAEQPAG